MQPSKPACLLTDRSSISTNNFAHERQSNQSRRFILPFSSASYSTTDSRPRVQSCPFRPLQTPVKPRALSTSNMLITEILPRYDVT
eukprot:767882-Hanusia_phi.AAC.1